MKLQKDQKFIRVIDNTDLSGKVKGLYCRFLLFIH